MTKYPFNERFGASQHNAPWRVRANRMGERRRRALIDALGGKCAACGSCRDLDLHHPYGRDWPHGLARHMRIDDYEEDARRGNLILLCKVCHVATPPKTPF